MKRLIIFFSLISLSSFGQIKFVLNDTIHVTRYGNPLANPWTGGINYAQWNEIDFNQDGKKDLFMFDRSDSRITILMNDGSLSPQAFHFDSNSVKYAKMFPALDGWAFLYDYDNDGLPDVFTAENSNLGIVAYKSSIVGGSWKFMLVKSPIMSEYSPGIFFNIAASDYLTPFFVDMDGDGDMDIVGQQLSCVGTVAYYKNFAMETLGNANSLDSFKTMTNSWGHYALRQEHFGICNVVANLWNANCMARPDEPNRNVRDTSDLRVNHDTYSCFTVMNLNGDSLMDVLIGDSQTKNLLALYNIGSRNDAQMDSVTQDSLFPKYNKPLKQSYFNCPSYVDVDNDGKKDLIAGNREYEDRKGVIYYKNGGTNSFPNLSYQNDSLFQSGMIDAGEGAAPVFFDYDNDGLLDLIVSATYATDTSCGSSNYRAALTLYRNVGTAANPAFQFVTKDFGGLSALPWEFGQCPLYPAFGDLDGDGKKDLLIGDQNGKLMFFKNKAVQVTDPAVFSIPPVSSYMGIDVGNCSTPQLIDLDNDGDLDLVIGEENGILNYFQNTGSVSAASFTSTPSIDSFGKVDVHYLNYTDGFSVPYIFNDKGSFKMLVSCMQGDVFLYGNVTAIPGDSFPLIDTILQKDYGNRFGYNLSVSGGDINDDGDIDMLLGLYGGGAQIYYGDFPIGINEAANPKIFFDVYPNPVSETLNLNIHRMGQNENYLLIVFNSIGAVVYSQRVSSGYHTIETKGFSNGIYLVQLRSSEQCISARVVVSH